MLAEERLFEGIGTAAMKDRVEAAKLTKKSFPPLLSVALKCRYKSRHDQHDQNTEDYSYHP